MVVATEELSWGSLGVGGSLITRPEILTRAIVAGGTDEQKQRWLPRIAAGELMVGVMVTEPDFGSDVAGVTDHAATAVDGGYRINGVKTWATFAGRAERAHAARPHRSRPLRATPRAVAVRRREGAVPGHSFAFEQDGGGKLEGRAIDTHRLPRHALVRGVVLRLVRAGREPRRRETRGLGRGFYLQMEGFENGRLQTAARAVGLMQAAFEAGPRVRARAQGVRQAGVRLPAEQGEARAHGGARSRPAASSPTTSRARMGRGEGTFSASMVKAYVCRAAEWVTREAMQLHGGMGYAEEFPVSRYFVDARVLSIFEGADETLCLRVIARRLAEQAL